MFLIQKNLFFTIKTKIFECPKYRIFPKGLTHCQKMPIFSFFGFGQNKTGVPKIAFFQRG